MITCKVWRERSFVLGLGEGGGGVWKEFWEGEVSSCELCVPSKVLRVYGGVILKIILLFCIVLVVCGEGLLLL